MTFKGYIRSPFFIVTLIVLGIFSCDKDFANLGSDIIGNVNYGTGNITYPVITFNQDVGPVQSNNLPAYLLGYNNDQVYGSATTSFVGQIALSEYNVTFGDNPVLDSVVLYIPYFSRLVETDVDGNNTYLIDSIFGDSPIKLSVYKNDYFLRGFNPVEEFNDVLEYYSDKTTSDGSLINDLDLEGELLFETNDFVPNEEQIILTEYDEELDSTSITNRLAPGMRFILDNPNELWESLFFEKEGEPELSNESNFLNHFRGLYVKAEAVGENGTLMMLNIGSNASLTLHYTSESETTPDDGGDSEVTTSPGTVTMSFSGNLVNFVDDTFIDIPDGNQEEGDEQLYLKGIQGNMAVINLFNGDEDGNSPELDDFKSNNWLINQAEIEFYVDQSAVQGEEPDRIYIYNLESNAPLIDYILDQSVSATQINAKIDHLKPLVRVDEAADGEGIKYKIEITEHINNILLRDSTNAKLGLVVSTNVNSIEPLDLQNEVGALSRTVSGYFLSPRGTVLFGNNTSDEDKQVKLKIYYTEPEN